MKIEYLDHISIDAPSPADLVAWKMVRSINWESFPVAVRMVSAQERSMIQRYAKKKGSKKWRSQMGYISNIRMFF